MKKKLVFVTNPFSGARSKQNLVSLLNQNIEKDLFDYELIYTQYPQHATQISIDAAANGVFAVIAVGGDGTINEVAQGLLHTNTALGILPFGSGNGFSYHLGFKRDIIKALQAINKCQVSSIDTGSANGRFFINVAGLGLDATVAYKTKLNTKRGFLPYFINTLRESLDFKFMSLSIESKELSITGEYAMAAVANGSIYGYEFAVAPEAKLDDGLFDVLLVKKTQIFRYFLLVPMMLNKTFHKSSLVDFIRTDQIKITNHSNAYFHVDGEGLEGDYEISFQIHPKSLLLLH
ncbi:MAG: diacylglycerol kinase family protein [Saprospiraceae bacterium]